MSVDFIHFEEILDSEICDSAQLLNLYRMAIKKLHINTQRLKIKILKYMIIVVTALLYWSQGVEYQACCFTFQ